MVPFERTDQPQLISNQTKVADASNSPRARAEVLQLFFLLQQRLLEFLGIFKAILSCPK